LVTPDRSNWCCGRRGVGHRADGGGGDFGAAGRLADRIGVVSTYVSHGVYRGIKRHGIPAAPTDCAVLQGSVAMDLAVRAIKRRLTIRHAGPRIVTLRPEHIDLIGTGASLAPATFVPVFEVSN